MKKTILRIIYLVFVFIVSCLLISKVMSQGNTDTTMEMAMPTYPVMNFVIGNVAVNELHGYAHAMDCNYMRENILPVSSDRTVYYEINCYGNQIDSMLFEIRSLDGKRLVESTPVTDYALIGDSMRGNFVVKDLIDPNREYILVFIMNLASGQEIRYYSRIIQTENYHIEDKLAYVKQFHEKSFRKEKVGDLSKYMEPNALGDNTTLSKVNIHSNLNQVSFANLTVAKVTEPAIRVMEIAEQTGSFELSYILSADYNNRKEYYFMKEKYRIRYTKDRIYLLDYNRTMDQIFNEENDVYANDKIDLGITDPDVTLVESEGGNVFAFATKGKLYSYNVIDHKIAELFSFLTESVTDRRAIYQNHGIKILNVDEAGNVEFLVYGYMNRGRHEGCVGLAVYTYNSMYNTVEENCYLDYPKSYQIMENEVNQLSYVSRDSIAYLMLDGTVYALDLNQHRYEVMASHLVNGSYQVSKSNQMLVYQKDGELYSCSTLVEFDLRDGSSQEIKAPAGDYIIPIGFMGEDLVYGLAHKRDVQVDYKGDTKFPIYSVRIQDEKGELLKNYQQENTYIMSWTLEENQIRLELANRNDKDEYVSAQGDQIVNTEEVKIGNNTICTAITDEYEKIVQIQTKAEIKNKSLKLLTPKEVLFEERREFSLQSAKGEKTRYYVYTLEGVSGIYNRPAPAIRKAYEQAGVVVNDQGEYVWIRGNLVSRNQIMAIKGVEKVTEQESTACVLDTILKYNGVSTNSQILLEKGDSVMKILQNNLQNATILDLTGCNLESILYYINRDIPVMAMLNDGTAVSITGFNETQVVILNPVKGELYKISRNEASLWFETNGNNFISYIPIIE